MPPPGRFSLTRLFLLIVGAAALLYLAAGSYAWLELRAAHQRINAAHRDSAQREVRLAAEQLLADADQHMQRVASWEEVRQQLHTPQYYQFWRDNRLPTAGLPGYFITVELYAADGRALSGNVSPPLLPEQPDAGGRSTLVRTQGRDFLILQHSVTSPEQSAAHGSVVAVIDLAAGLNRGGFRYAQLDSRVTTLPEEARVVSSDIGNKIRFRVRANVVFDEYRPVVRSTFGYLLVATVLTLFIGWMGITRLVGQPLRRLRRHLRDLARDDSHNAGLGGRFVIRELETVRAAINSYQSRLEVVHRGLDRKNRRLWKLAHHDPLTGCLNRRAFEDDWKHLVELAIKNATSVSLLLVDCNHFKAINDSYGHSVGDEVLKGIGNIMRQSLQRGDRLYRLASDEFAVIFVDAAQEHALEVARASLETIQQHGFTHLDINEPVRVSVGIAHSDSGEPDELKQLYRRANVAMFRAKRPGAPPLSVYVPEMEDVGSAAFSTRAAGAVDLAVRTGENITMCYQPVFSLADRQCRHVEALVRLRSDGELITPEEFFLQLETRRLEAEFDWAVLAAVLQDMENDIVPPGQGVSINLSGATLVTPELEDRLQSLQPFIAKRELIIEVAETTMISQLRVATEKLARLRKLGFKVALDDFGSGYSTLRYLADMPVDIVKFDISLVHALCENTPRGRMLAKLVGLLREPGYTLLAEGIESEQMAEVALDLGFDYAQGYLFGHPARARD